MKLHRIKQMQFPEEFGGFQCMALHPHDDRVAIGFGGGTIGIWSMPDLQLLDRHTHEATYPLVLGIAWAPDGYTLFSTSDDGCRVLVWTHGLSLAPQVLYHGPADDQDELGYAAWDGFQPAKLCVDPTGRWLACGGGLDGRIKLWDCHLDRGAGHPGS